MDAVCSLANIASFHFGFSRGGLLAVVDVVHFLTMYIPAGELVSE